MPFGLVNAKDWLETPAAQKVLTCLSQTAALRSLLLLGGPNGVGKSALSMTPLRSIPAVDHSSDFASASTAAAFIKTLNPAAGWALTNFVTVDMTAIPSTWAGYSVSLTIDASLVGQVFR